MMEKITYLLGAGASFNALPIVKDLPKAISDVVTALEVGPFNQMTVWNDFRENNVTTAPPNSLDALALAKSDLKELQKGCEAHLSIDTYAKMLFLTNRKEYQRMKAATVLFFELYQCLNRKADMRYDAFLASIIQDSFDKLPAHVNILSWNYDRQIEIAYQKYLDSAGISDAEPSQYLNIYAKGEHVRNYEVDGFCVFKVNGTVYFLDEQDRSYPLEKSEWNITPHQDIILSYWNACQKNHNSALSFNWEHDGTGDRMEGALSLALRDTSVLVVIGYSFPFFNRTSDTKLLGMMQRLDKIYIQDPSADDLKERVRAILPGIKVNTLHDTTQFYLPHEL
jgi:hypothetical protein